MKIISSPKNSRPFFDVVIFLHRNEIIDQNWIRVITVLTTKKTTTSCLCSVGSFDPLEKKIVIPTSFSDSIYLER